MNDVQPIQNNNNTTDIDKLITNIATSYCNQPTNNCANGVICPRIESNHVSGQWCRDWLNLYNSYCPYVNTPSPTQNNKLATNYNSTMLKSDLTKFSTSSLNTTQTSDSGGWFWLLLIIIIIIIAVVIYLWKKNKITFNLSK